MTHDQAALAAKAHEVRDEGASASHDPTYAAHPERRLTSRQVRQLLGDCSDMFIWRRLNDDSGFPRPTYISKRRFWLERDVLAWLESQAPAAD